MSLTAKEHYDKANKHLDSANKMILDVSKLMANDGNASAFTSEMSDFIGLQIRMAEVHLSFAESLIGTTVHPAYTTHTAPFDDEDVRP